MHALNLPHLVFLVLPTMLHRSMLRYLLFPNDQFSFPVSVKTLHECGYEAIVINNNPETVSTDYSISDKLYFEPLTLEDVMHVIEWEQPLGVIVQFGGQTAINLADGLVAKS